MGYCRSQWTRGLRRRSAAARLLRSWVRIPPGAWTFVCCESCECQVEVSARSWSLVQRSPTDCVVSLCVINKPQEWRGHGPRWAAAPQERKKNIWVISHKHGMVGFPQQKTLPRSAAISTVINSMDCTTANWTNITQPQSLRIACAYSSDALMWFALYLSASCFSITQARIVYESWLLATTADILLVRLV